MNIARLALALALLGVVSIAGALTPKPVSALETSYQNPVTAAPPLNRPTTSSCIVSLAQNQAFPFAGYDTQFTGTYNPPSQCPSPWSMVVLDLTGHVAGRQFDREAAIWIGNAMVYMGTTPEPTPAGITWHVEKDLSEYTPLLTHNQPYAIQIPNLVNKVYAGTIYINTTLTFYKTSGSFPAAAHPDVILPLSASWLFVPQRTTVSAHSVTLPTNPVQVQLELWAKGNSCDEFWFGSQPDAYANANGLCGGGAFREIKVFLDGTLAGVVWPFPYVFTGGVNPYLWRPIPAVDAFNEPAYIVDLTPFAGTLNDGSPHTLGFQVVNNGFYWQIDGNLLINVDPGSAATSGQLTTYNVMPNATQTVAQIINNNGGLFHFTATESLTISGYVDTSKGRFTTTIHQDFGFTNDQVLDLVNFLENLKGTEAITTMTTTIGPSGSTTLTTADSYPIVMTSAFIIPPASGSVSSGPLRFILPATVTQSFTRNTIMNSNGQIVSISTLSDTVRSEAVLGRVLSTGANFVAAGEDSEDYDLSDSTGACYNHLIMASQGLITMDTMLPTC